MTTFFPRPFLLTLLFPLCLTAENELYEEAALPIAPIEVGDPDRLELRPPAFTLSGTRQRLQLQVTAYYPNGEKADLTRAVSFRVENSEVAAVDAFGRVAPKADGETKLVVEAGGLRAETALTVRGAGKPSPVSFRSQVLPVFSKTGCSMGACHGAPHGKGGFRLSLRASDPALDLKTITLEEFGRRVNLVEPERSLLLAKPQTEVSHEGGQRLRPSDLERHLLLDWIREGCVDDEEAPSCVGIRITPSDGAFLRRPHHVTQFRVEADFADGSVRDVTHLSVFESSDEKVCKVSRRGLAVGLQRGEAAVIVRYLSRVRSVLLGFVEDVEGFSWKAPAPANYVDERVYAKLKRFQYLPSEPCDDETFLRRLHLDLTGLTPSPERVLRFLEDEAPDKRAVLIDELLDSEEFYAFWAQKWGDLLKVSTKKMGFSGALKFHRWIRRSLTVNQPYDEFARAILLANGSNFTNPPTNFYRAGSDVSDLMESTTQLFLGARIGCAKCHNHPYEPWTQDNYYGLSAFFNRIRTKKTGRKEEVFVWMEKEGEVKHPVTGAVVEPWAPGASNLVPAEGEDRRHAFVRWLTDGQNPFFAKVEANRIWAHLLGRGIVEPFDDLRDSNPPANAPLLDALAADFAARGFDRRHLIRLIVSSNTYQASSRPNAFNRDDRRFFSRYLPRRLTAEQLLDALGELTDAPERFPSVHPATKATQLPAPDLKPHDRGKIGEIEFLKVFGQPERQTVCECERGDESSLGQAFELYNGKTVHRMLTNRSNRFHRALNEKKPREEILDDLFLRAFSRKPESRETNVLLTYLDEAEDERRAFEDLVWALINKDEFLFQH